MKEKLVELLRRCVMQNVTTDPDCWDAIIDVDYGKMADHLLANGVTVQKWIPVTERLPDYETEVLTYRKSGISVETRWRTYWDYDEFSDCPVTHWMHLPEAPKGE